MIFAKLKPGIQFEIDTFISYDVGSNDILLKLDTINKNEAVCLRNGKVIRVPWDQEVVECHANQSN